jgi:hypothetical protein
MKMTRDDLKVIVKECLLELLNEGLGNAPRRAGAPIAGLAQERRAPGRRAPAFDPRLDVPLAGGRTPSAALQETIKRESGGNSVMADILADTAATTLPAQLAHGDSALGSSFPLPAQQEQFSGSPEDAFGSGADRWADLAFAEPKKKSA